MKFKLLFLTLFLIAALLVGNVSANMALNSSFEKGVWSSADDVPPDWVFYEIYSATGLGGDARWENTADAGHNVLLGSAKSGTRFVSLDGNGNGGGGAYRQAVLYPAAAIPVVAGTTYFWSVWQKDNPTVAGGGQYDLNMQWDTGNVEVRDAIDDPATAEYETAPVEWTQHVLEFVAPAGATSVTPLILNWYADWTTWATGNGVLLDDMYFSDKNPLSVHTPNPEDGGAIVPGPVTLSWLKEKKDDGNDAWIEVWWGNTADDPNFWDGDPSAAAATKAMTLANVTSLDLSSTLLGDLTPTAGNNYYWALKYEDTASTGTPGTNPLVKGPIWKFDTHNLPPIVNAGLNQSVWVSGGSASVTLTGTVTDDGQPSPPGALVYTWSRVSGPPKDTINTPTGAVVGGVVSTTVDFTGQGKFTFELEVEDDPTNVSGGFGKSATDTVVVYVVAEVTDGLVAHWTFDTNYDDSEPGAHHGTPSGNASIDGDAQIGAGSLLLDGDDYVNVGGECSTPSCDPNFPTWASPSRLPILQDHGVMSVTCWIKSDNMLKTWASIISKGNEDGWKIQRDDSSNDVIFTVNNVDGAYSGGGAAIDDVSDGKWHHIAGVFMSDASYIYIDGVLGDTALWSSVDTPVQGGVMDLWIGDHPDWPGNGFVGRIDDVKLYQVPLNAAKIIAEYAAGGGSNSCGGKYAATDLNQNCYHDLGDYAIFAAGYLECNDIANPSCTP